MDYPRIQLKAAVLDFIKSYDGDVEIEAALRKQFSDVKGVEIKRCLFELADEALVRLTYFDRFIETAKFVGSKD